MNKYYIVFADRLNNSISKLQKFREKILVERVEI